jgi:hypothetical protein
MPASIFTPPFVKLAFQDLALPSPCAWKSLIVHPAASNFFLVSSNASAALRPLK